MLQHIKLFSTTVCLELWKQFGEGPHTGVMVKCPHAFGHIVYLYCKSVACNCCRFFFKLVILAYLKCLLAEFKNCPCCSFLLLLFFSHYREILTLVPMVKVHMLQM